MAVILAAAVAGAALRIAHLRLRVLLGWFGISLALTIALGLAELDTDPWNNLLVVSLALTAGTGLGRAVPARFRPMLLLLLALSAFDILQIALTSGPPPGSHAGQPPAWLLYANFRVTVAGVRIAIGVADLALAAAMAVHLRRRGATWPVAAGAAPAGLVLADLFLLATGPRNLPLVPFLTAGWFAAAAIPRRVP